MDFKSISAREGIPGNKLAAKKGGGKREGMDRESRVGVLEETGMWETRTGKANTCNCYC